jgi:outer membrane biosynthesis protein TonB
MKLLLTLCTIFICGSLNATHLFDTTKTKQKKLIETEAVYPGGINALIALLSKNIEYPSYEQKNNIEGEVIVEFVIDKNGNCGNFTVLKSSSQNFSNEAIRII